ncbi:class F sortase [Amycolatopsis sp. H20-H5]|uniref:class F sortase n=1 Tax=Amycolatopsis sp. H20-H5 TaxID=3046309 RepID=UPI002DBB8C3C|nr:class F sortase [Amycolatopsis sp. H20-H5]MEC3982526.1 class F sortase [Amycolatopsis sp. H20-H5]
MAEPHPAASAGQETGGRHSDARRSRPHSARAILLAVALVLGLGGGGLIWTGVTRATGPEQPTSTTSSPIPLPVAPSPVNTSAQASPSPAPTVPLPRSTPVSIQVPSIGVNSALLSLGLNPDQTVEAPKDFSKAGWYDYGPTPGEAGASVILGHIDSYRGPAVFYRLSKLNPGDQIVVTRNDGSTATFTADTRRQYPKSQFPANDVYGAVDYAGLRLVTCGGQFDGKARSYLDNIVVYAHLTATTSPRQP